MTASLTYCHYFTRTLIFNKPTNCDNQIALTAAELIKEHHGIGDQLVFAEINHKHLLWIEVLNVVDEFCSLNPFSPDAKKLSKNRRSGIRKYIVLLANFEGCYHRTNDLETPLKRFRQIADDSDYVVLYITRALRLQLSLSNHITASVINLLLV